METPHSILKKFFGYDSFRPGQEQIVQRLLAGQDVLAVMPTGAGKSIIIGSINIALGGKVSKDIIRTGTEFALVELTF